MEAPCCPSFALRASADKDQHAYEGGRRNRCWYRGAGGEMFRHRPGRAETGNMNESTNNPLRRGWAAGRTNIVPGMIIVLVALGVLAGYHRWPVFHDAMEVVGAWKTRFGLLFPLVSTAVFGGLLPVFFRLIPPETRKDPQWRHLPFFVLFWAYKGIEVDLLYRLQAWVFGDTADPWVVAAKVVVDQLVYCPVWAVPTMVLAYRWKEAGYNVGETRRRLGERWYVNRCLPVLVASLVIWVPAVAVIYNLPLALQLPLQNLVLCLFVLLVMILTGDGGKSPRPEPEAASRR